MLYLAGASAVGGTLRADVRGKDFGAVGFPALLVLDYNQLDLVQGSTDLATYKKKVR